MGSRRGRRRGGWNRGEDGGERQKHEGERGEGRERGGEGGEVRK